MALPSGNSQPKTGRSACGGIWYMPYRGPLLKEVTDTATTSEAFWCGVLGSTLAIRICGIMAESHSHAQTPTLPSKGWSQRALGFPGEH